MISAEHQKDNNHGGNQPTEAEPATTMTPLLRRAAGQASRIRVPDGLRGALERATVLTVRLTQNIYTFLRGAIGAGAKPAEWNIILRIGLALLLNSWQRLRCRSVGSLEVLSEVVTRCRGRCRDRNAARRNNDVLARTWACILGVTSGL